MTKQVAPRARPVAFVLALTGLMLGVAGGAPAQAAKPGNLDRSFGGNGEVKTRFLGQTHNEARAVMIDSKGRIVAAGYVATATNFAVARFKPNGTLDHSFSGDGRVTTRFSGGPGYVLNSADSVAIDSEGRIVATGFKCNYTAPPSEGGEEISCETALARYKPNGSLDPSFGDGGKVTADLEGCCGATVAIDSQDRVIVAGGNGVARFRVNGTLDPSFGNGGEAITSFTGNVRAVAIDSQGAIAAVGDQYDGSVDRFLVARFLPNGNPDPSFGSGQGWITTRRGFATSVTLDSKDDILAAGGIRQVGSSATRKNFALALYKPDGSPARRFGQGGEVTTHWTSGKHSALALSVTRDSRGRVVAVGSIGHDYAIARYRANGKLDPSFGGNGKVMGPFGLTSRDNNAGVWAGTVDSRDRIIVAGGQPFLLNRFIG